MTENAKIAETLARGKLVVMKSDTIYGIFCSALNESAVKKLKTVRSRADERGFIMLVDSVETIVNMVDPDYRTIQRLQNIFPKQPDPNLGATSAILPAKNLKQPWLGDSRYEEKEACFRVPNDENLRKLLKKTGPLCAPSVNMPGEPPARNIAEAKNYFDDVVDLYVDDGECDNIATSRIIKFGQDGIITTVRSDGRNHPEDFVITRRRKLYKFARFDEYPTCFHLDEWLTSNIRSHLIEKGEIVVEVGAGSALFLVELAQRHPEKTFIAIDIKGDRLYQGAHRAEQLGLKNIYFVRADIARITEIVLPHSVSEIWLTFSDPYPRKSDAKHRLTAPRYLDYYRKILNIRSHLIEKGGILHFKTDNSPLFEWSLEQFKDNGWVIDFLTRDLHNSDALDEAKVVTSYEQRFVKEGLKINYAKFSRNQ